MTSEERQQIMVNEFHKWRAKNPEQTDNDNIRAFSCFISGFCAGFETGCEEAAQLATDGCVERFTQMLEERLSEIR